MSKKKSYLFFVEAFLFLIWSVLGGLLNVKLRNNDSSNNNFLIIGLKCIQVLWCYILQGFLKLILFCVFVSSALFWFVVVDKCLLVLVPGELWEIIFKGQLLGFDYFFRCVQFHIELNISCVKKIKICALHYHYDPIHFLEVFVRNNTL